MNARVRGVGYQTVTEFLRSLPSTGYKEVARLLGVDIAPIQLIRIQLSEAIESGELRSAAIDVLVRRLAGAWTDTFSSVSNEADPNHVQMLMAARTSAFGAWINDVSQSATVATSGVRAWALAVARELSPEVKRGWIPQENFDPVLLAAFQRHWPTD